MCTLGMLPHQISKQQDDDFRHSTELSLLKDLNYLGL